MKKICLLCFSLLTLCTISAKADAVKEYIANKIITRSYSTDTVYNIWLYGVMEAVNPNKDGYLSIYGEEGEFTMSMEKNGEYNEVVVYKLKVASYKRTYFKEEGDYYNWTGELILNAINPQNNSVVGQLKGEYGCNQEKCSYHGVFTDFKGIKSSFSFQMDNTLEMGEEP